MMRRKLKRSTPEEEENFARQLEEARPTAKDRFAMVLSAFLMLFLPCALILGGLGLLMLWLFGGLGANGNPIENPGEPLRFAGIFWCNQR